MTQPLISVLMSVFNNASYLHKAIDSVLAQSFGNFEFLIVDDGSTDGSSEIIDRFAAQDARVRAIHQENRGLVASLNRLIEEARAPLLARMDGDDICLPQRFERQIAFLDANPDHGVVGTWTICIDEEDRPWPHDELGHPVDFESFLHNLQDGPLLCHSSVMMRSEVVREANGYRRVYAHCEDYDLWLRLSERTKLCSLPERLILYRHSESQVSSRHVLAQQTGAAVAWLAHVERISGRPDPTASLDRLPPIDALDELFGREGVAKAVRARVAPTLVYSKVEMLDAGFDIVCRYIRDGGSHDGMWRTVARLLTFGEPVRAARLARLLATA